MPDRVSLRWSRLARNDTWTDAMQSPEFLDRTFAGSSLMAWLWAAGTLAAVVLGLWLVKVFVLRRLDKIAGRTKTRADDLVVILLRRTRFMLVAWLAITIALRILTIPESGRELLGHIAVLAFLLQLGIWANGAIEFWVSGHTRERIATDASSVTTIRAVGFGLRLLAWTIVLLLVLDNLGVDVTALITGLGIGGVAVALAVQNILGDIFAALAIVLDKPFVIGDYIVVGTEMGTVEKIGIKTTRVRSLGGEQIIFSNAELLKSRIRNYKRMEERRILFRFGVLYSTPPEIVEQLPRIAREAVQSQERVRFDRAHFAAMSDSSLDIEVVYYVLSPEYATYMEVQQGINLQLLRRVQEAGADFAFPTRTLHVQGSLDGLRATEPSDEASEVQSRE
jgi:small-conductance mechanosensitive channel